MSFFLSEALVISEEDTLTMPRVEALPQSWANWVLFFPLHRQTFFHHFFSFLVGLSSGNPATLIS